MSGCNSFSFRALHSHYQVPDSGVVFPVVPIFGPLSKETGLWTGLAASVSLVGIDQFEGTKFKQVQVYLAMQNSHLFFISFIYSFIQQIFIECQLILSVNNFLCGHRKYSHPFHHLHGLIWSELEETVMPPISVPAHLWRFPLVIWHIPGLCGR